MKYFHNCSKSIIQVVCLRIMHMVCFSFARPDHLCNRASTFTHFLEIHLHKCPDRPTKFSARQVGWFGIKLGLIQDSAQGFAVPPGRGSGIASPKLSQGRHSGAASGSQSGPPKRRWGEASGPKEQECKRGTFFQTPRATAQCAIGTQSQPFGVVYWPGRKKAAGCQDPALGRNYSLT